MPDNNPPTGSISILGELKPGHTLTVSNQLGDADGLGLMSYQWAHNGTDIIGAIGSTYLVSESDIGLTLTVAIQYTDGAGTLESVTSAASAIVTAMSGITWTGTSASERYVSGGGDDILNAGDGDDEILSGAGADIIDGGRGNDLIYGGAGNDVITDEDLTSTTGQQLHGEDGDDHITGGGQIYGGEGNDTINVTENSSQIYGDDGNDIINVTASSVSQIHGGNGDDVITVDGSSSSYSYIDSVYGGDGDDVITIDFGGSE